jgi:hypothetical protein
MNAKITAVAKFGIFTRKLLQLVGQISCLIGSSPAAFIAEGTPLFLRFVRREGSGCHLRLPQALSSNCHIIATNSSLAMGYFPHFNLFCPQIRH